MGMYTGLRMKGRIKQEALSAIKKLHEGMHWILLQREYPSLVGLRFLSVHRAAYIPFGYVCDIPGWDDNDPAWKRSLENNYFTFQCSLKNTENTIEVFLEEVAPRIFETLDYCETRYCEDDTSKHYALVDETITLRTTATASQQ